MRNVCCRFLTLTLSGLFLAIFLSPPYAHAEIEWIEIDSGTYFGDGFSLDKSEAHDECRESTEAMYKQLAADCCGSDASSDYPQHEGRCAGGYNGPENNRSFFGGVAAYFCWPGYTEEEMATGYWYVHADEREYTCSELVNTNDIYEEDDILEEEEEEYPEEYPEEYEDYINTSNEIEKEEAEEYPDYSTEYDSGTETADEVNSTYDPYAGYYGSYGSLSGMALSSGPSVSPPGLSPPGPGTTPGSTPSTPVPPVPDYDYYNSDEYREIMEQWATPVEEEPEYLPGGGRGTYEDYMNGLGGLLGAAPA